MSGLEGRLIARIRAGGPISLADYMAACLLDPRDGYYRQAEPFGRAGDFVTAPEVSQMFGELLGLALAQAWVDQGRPAPFVLAELGPGRGTLMADALRAARAVPGFAEAAQVELVEASERLRAVQARTLAGHRIAWCDGVEALPQGPLFLFANEFLDALPIRQFRREANGWRERMVGLADGQLAFGLAPVAPLAALDHRLADTAPGDVVETRAPAAAIAGEVGRRIAGHGGAAIFIDYGGWRSKGDTFQAVRGHAFADPLRGPGRADLTAHVDFEALAGALAPARATPMVTQAELLGRLGIAARAEALARTLSGPALDDLHAAFDRLTGEAEMGTLFKALAAYPPGGPVPAGFGP